MNDQKGFYHCFSSAEHGNIFDFLMKTQSLKFGEAVKQLAALAGVPIYKFSKIDEQREKNWKLYEKITIVEGWTYTQLNELLKKQITDMIESSIYNYILHST